MIGIPARKVLIAGGGVIYVFVFLYIEKSHDLQHPTKHLRVGRGKTHELRRISINVTSEILAG